MSFRQVLTSRVGSLIVASGAALTAVLGVSQAETAPAAPKDDRGTVTIVWENDKFFSTDRNYTNGARLSWLSGTSKPSGMSKIAADLVGSSDRAAHRRGFAIGQSIFTPRDITVPIPPPDQQPYAGWLYAELNAVIEQRNIVDTLALQIGLVGPQAGAEWSQNNVHSLIGVEEAEGWDTQISNMVGVNLSYDKKLRRVTRFGDSQFAADITPNIGLALGNINTNAHAGLTVRMGQNLINDFGPPRVAPSLGGVGYFTPQDVFSWYFFAGVEGRAVLHNVFIDGSPSGDDNITLSTKPYVTDMQGGLVIQYSDFQLAITGVERTKEFEEQFDRQRFGAFSISKKL